MDLTAHTASGFASLLGVENVTAGSGNDTLTGDAAANVLAGGAGNDTYFVGVGDTVTEGAGAGTDTVNSTATFTLGANVENLTLTGSADINGTGNGLANVMIGNTGANVLNGAAGNDTLDGGLGNDTMTGGTGNDMFVFHTGFGNDVITDFDANPTGGQDLLDLSAYATGHRRRQLCRAREHRRERRQYGGHHRRHPAHHVDGCHGGGRKHHHNAGLHSVAVGLVKVGALIVLAEEEGMYISPKASRIRQREAQRARDNRAEIVKARSLGQITRRDLFRWGIFTAAACCSARTA